MNEMDQEFMLSELNRFRKRSLAGRISLGALGCAQLFLAVPWLFGSSPIWGDSHTAVLHVTRDGAFGLMFGGAAIVVAFSVRLAWFALPVVVVLMVAQAVVGYADFQNLEVSSGFEWVHMLSALIGIGIALFVKPRRRQPKEDQSRHLSAVKPPIQID